MDQMVLETQQWLNATYTGRTGYSLITENGNTGWSTIYALLHALQIELGITSTADSFGPTTINRFNSRFPNGVLQQPDEASIEDNIYAIIQGALWCKGYSTGSHITKHFYGGTGGAVKELKVDAGLSDITSTVTLDIMKCLMSMDQFILVAGGSSKIRTIQQKMNSKYLNLVGLGPCDGIYGRKMNTSLIMILQKIEQPANVTDANYPITQTFGPRTIELLPYLPGNNNSNNILSSSKLGDAILLVRYTLCCNGYENVDIFSSNWDSSLKEIIQTFQHDLALNSSGNVATDTWMSLLLSKGNPDRHCIASDTRFEMTDERLNYLKSNGYSIVGRYLTGTEFKVLRDDEPQRILDHGICFFPIFQESSTDVTYFTAARAKQDSISAITAALKFKLPPKTVIYFAVDIDVTDPQITSYILPYFKALSETPMPQVYRIGIYGTRNTCTRVINSGYALTAFISDMSTGYSGNMGFKMPTTWTFDQFAEISITTASGNWDLDKVAYSGRNFYPVMYLEKGGEYAYVQPSKPNISELSGMTSILSFISNIVQLENVCLNYCNSHLIDVMNPKNFASKITNYMRHVNYTGIEWGITTMSPIDTNFVNYVKTNHNSLYNSIQSYINGTLQLSDGQKGILDLAHLVATTEGNFSSPIVPAFWTGWGGDLATAMAQIDEAMLRTPDLYAQKYADSLIGLNNDILSSFNYADMCCDADAIMIADLIKNSSSMYHALSDSLNTYYTQHVQDRYFYYLGDLASLNNLEEIKTKLIEKMHGAAEVLYLLPKKGNNPSDLAYLYACYSFANYIFYEASNHLNN